MNLSDAESAREHQRLARRMRSHRTTCPRAPQWLKGWKALPLVSTPLFTSFAAKTSEILPLSESLIVVTGLPRSGTSVLIQMLAAGGMGVLSDGLREADEDNPRGYLEFEPVKNLLKDSKWLVERRGKVIKIVAPLLAALPPGLACRVILSERDLDEVLDSQERMLIRRNQPLAATPERRQMLKDEYARTLGRVKAMLTDPQQGLRWTAKTASGFTTTQISSHGMFYREGTPSIVPLRLQEAHAALFDPIPSTGWVDRDQIRTSTSAFNGNPVTCVLLSGAGNAPTVTSGRRWEETEECVDPKSGLLMVHSQVPGRYFAYDYSDGLQLAGHAFPRRVTVTEAGRIVSEISVDSLTELPSADPSLFVPTDEMIAGGPAIAMEEAQKISHFPGRGQISSHVTVHPVCVFGLATPSGQLLEVHSLQPSDPNSQAAVDAAQRMNFSSPVPAGARPEQHFVFVIEKFIASP